MADYEPHPGTELLDPELVEMPDDIENYDIVTEGEPEPVESAPDPEEEPGFTTYSAKTKEVGGELYVLRRDFNTDITEYVPLSDYLEGETLTAYLKMRDEDKTEFVVPDEGMSTEDEQVYLIYSFVNGEMITTPISEAEYKEMQDPEDAALLDDEDDSLGYSQPSPAQPDLLSSEFQLPPLPPADSTTANAIVSPYAQASAQRPTPAQPPAQTSMATKPFWAETSTAQPEPTRAVGPKPLHEPPAFNPETDTTPVPTAETAPDEAQAVVAQAAVAEVPDTPAIEEPEPTFVDRLIAPEVPKTEAAPASNKLESVPKLILDELQPVNTPEPGGGHTAEQPSETTTPTTASIEAVAPVIESPQITEATPAVTAAEQAEPSQIDAPKVTGEHPEAIEEHPEAAEAQTELHESAADDAAETATPTAATIVAGPVVASVTPAPTRAIPVTANLATEKSVATAQPAQQRVEQTVAPTRPEATSPTRPEAANHLVATALPLEAPKHESAPTVLTTLEITSHDLENPVVQQVQRYEPTTAPVEQMAATRPEPSVKNGTQFQKTAIHSTEATAPLEPAYQTSEKIENDSQKITSPEQPLPSITVPETASAPTPKRQSVPELQNWANDFGAAEATPAPDWYREQSNAPSAQSENFARPAAAGQYFAAAADDEDGIAINFESEQRGPAKRRRSTTTRSTTV